MKLEDLKYIKETLEYALNDCPVKDGDHETHFNTFANAISLVDAELNLLNIPVVVLQSEQLKCLCCDGTGIVEGESYDDKQSCLTCSGRGHFN